MGESALKTISFILFDVLVTLLLDLGLLGISHATAASAYSANIFFTSRLLASCRDTKALSSRPIGLNPRYSHDGAVCIFDKSLHQEQAQRHDDHAPSEA
jgi:hypothetical protein